MQSLLKGNCVSISLGSEQIISWIYYFEMEWIYILTGKEGIPMGICGLLFQLGSGENGEDFVQQLWSTVVSVSHAIIGSPNLV